MNDDFKTLNEECIKLNLSAPRERVYLMARIIELQKVRKGDAILYEKLATELRIEKEVNARVIAALSAAISPR